MGRDMGFQLPQGWELAAPKAETVQQLINQIAALSRSGWSHRGEPRWYAQAIPSFGRQLRISFDPLTAEAVILQYFRSISFALATSRERAIMNNFLGIMIMMQHYGAPTRLLDWTRSPWIASYFAAVHNTSDDGYIWSYDPSPLFASSSTRSAVSIIDPALQSDDINDFLDSLKNAPECVLPLMTAECTDRMVAQQCCFTLGNPAGVDHRALIGNMLSGRKHHGSIMIIPSLLKQELMRHLSLMNVTGSVLFPGLDGVGRACVEAIQNENSSIPRLLYTSSSVAAMAPIGGPVPH